MHDILPSKAMVMAILTIQLAAVAFYRKKPAQSTKPFLQFWPFLHKENYLNAEKLVIKIISYPSKYFKVPQIALRL